VTGPRPSSVVLFRDSWSVSLTPPWAVICGTTAASTSAEPMIRRSTSPPAGASSARAALATRCGGTGSPAGTGGDSPAGSRWRYVIRWMSRRDFQVGLMLLTCGFLA
jgi:hypothetical protein